MRGRLVTRREGFETLILPPVHIPLGFAKGWATLTQKEVANAFPAAGASAVFGARFPGAMFLGVLVGSRWKSGCWQRRITSRK